MPSEQRERPAVHGAPAPLALAGAIRQMQGITDFTLGVGDHAPRGAMPMERRGRVIVVERGPLGQTGSLQFQRKAAAFVRWHEPDDARSITSGICERLGVKSPGPTRHQRCFGRSDDESGLPPTPERLRHCSESTLRAKCGHLGQQEFLAVTAVDRGSRGSPQRSNGELPGQGGKILDGHAATSRLTDEAMLDKAVHRPPHPRRMIADMTIRTFSEKSQRDYIPT